MLALFVDSYLDRPYKMKKKSVRASAELMIQQGFCVYTEHAIIYLKSVVILLKNEE